MHGNGSCSVDPYQLKTVLLCVDRPHECSRERIYYGVKRSLSARFSELLFVLGSPAWQHGFVEHAFLFRETMPKQSFRCRGTISGSLSDLNGI